VSIGIDDGLHIFNPSFEAQLYHKLALHSGVSFFFERLCRNSQDHTDVMLSNAKYLKFQLMQRRDSSPSAQNDIESQFSMVKNPGLE